MNKILRSLLCSIPSITFLCGCEKETAVNPVEISDSSAVYKLSFSDSACAITAVTGNYVVGQTLGTDAAMQLEVSVQKPGYFRLSTDTLNGYYFATSGAFTDTGTQTISLQGSGTPAVPGNSYFSVSAGGEKRIVSLAVLSSTLVTEAVPEESYFKGNIGGVFYYCSAGKQGPNGIPHAYGGTDSVSFSSYVSLGQYPLPAGSGIASVQKGFLYPYPSSTEADFKKFFAPGSYAIYPNKCDRMFPGVIISWVDSDGNVWSSLGKLVDETGSAFQIVGAADGHNDQGQYFVKVKTRFNCKLYNVLTGEVKELTDGEMVSYFFKP